MEKAFTVIRTKANRAIILAYPYDNEPYIVGTDDSDFGLRAWVGQRQKDGTFRYLSFTSSSLSNSESNYLATKKNYKLLYGL